MSKLIPQESPVSEALILICEKCGKKLSKSDHNPSRDLQQLLKERIKSEGKKGVLRAVTTSCLDLCPEGEITVAISRTGAPDEYFTWEGKDANEAANLILEKLN